MECTHFQIFCRIGLYPKETDFVARFDWILIIVKKKKGRVESVNSSCVYELIVVIWFCNLRNR